MLLLLFVAIFLLVLIYELIVKTIGPNIILKPKQREVLVDGEYVNSPADLGLDFENVEIKSFDGVVLKGWLVKTVHNPPICNVIYLHGTYTNKKFGLRRAKFLTENGFNVLLVDHRAHGESGGEFCTYGYLEKFDTSAWINFLLERYPDVPIALFGISMGGAVALQTAGIDNRICAVISEASFANFKDLVIEHQKKRIGFASKFIAEKILQNCERRAGFKISEISPLEFVKKISCPVLYIHGTNDRTVKLWNSELLHSSTLNSELFLAENAGHINIYEILGAKYEEKVVGFLKNACLKTKNR